MARSPSPGSPTPSAPPTQASRSRSSRSAGWWTSCTPRSWSPTHAQRIREDQADRAPRAPVARRARDATAGLTVTRLADGQGVAGQGVAGQQPRPGQHAAAPASSRPAPARATAPPLPAWNDGRIRLAVDVGNWLRPDAEASAERLFCHCYARGRGNAQMIPGWPYSVVAALEPGRAAWTLPLDAVRLGPADDATAVTAGQLRDVVMRIIDAGSGATAIRLCWPSSIPPMT